MLDNIGKEKKESKIDKLPRETKRIIFWFSIIILGILVFVFWLFTFQLSVKKIDLSGQNPIDNFEQLQIDLKKILENTANGINDIKNELNQTADQLNVPTSTATTTPESAEQPVLQN